jgi:polyadenylate-binding protein
MNPPYATASLYVGDLEPSCTESMLFETFKKVGTVSSIRVCRDVETRRSLGYAYVNFHNVADAERAIDTLNYTPVGGGDKPCRIMWSHRDPSLRRSGRGNIFIKNLDKSIEHKALCDTFSAFGNILSCKVSLDKDGNSRGFGFVHYENPEAADAAIEQVNGMLLCGKKVYVGPFLPRKNRGDSAGQVKFTNCFVKDLPLDLSDADLEKLFSSHGTTTSCVIQRKDDGTSLGFGFVNFENFDAARNAVEAMNGADVRGKKIFVARAQKKAEREQQLKRQFEERKMRFAESNVFVKNLDETTDDAKLKEHFGQFGTVVSAKVMRDDKGLSRGFGFVCFNTPEEAHKAINEPHKVLHGKPLYVALAQRKEVRSAQLQAQYAHRAAAGPGGQPGMVVGGRGAPLLPGQQPIFMMPPGAVPGGPGVRGTYAGPYPPQQAGARPPQWVQGGRAGGGPQQGGRGGYRAGNNPQQQQQGPYVINTAAGNVPVVVQQQAVVGGGPVAVGVPPPEAHPSLADLSEKDRKQVLGEFLYPKIEALLKSEKGDPSETGKITGMLLESLDHGELVHLLESPAELKSRVAEAIQVLREHLAATAGQ